MQQDPKQRRPGSQVAPRQKPFVRPGGTAQTHTRVPLHQATAGKIYRVRDRDTGDGNPKVWGEDLTWDDANKLKEQVVGSRRSKTARVEEMPVFEQDLEQDLSDAEDASTSTTTATGIRETLVRLFPGEPDIIDFFAEHVADPRCLWLLGYIERQGREPTPFNAPAADPQLEVARQRAVAAARPTAQAAQARADRTVTVGKPFVRAQPPPSDPPKPPPSPLSDELADLEDGPAELPEMPAGEVSDLLSEVGGAPQDDDKQRAAQQAVDDEAAQIAKARVAYEHAVTTQGGQWPRWDELGTFEHAGWRYYVTHGGTPPMLTWERRKVQHAMGGDPQ